MKRKIGKLISKLRSINLVILVGIGVLGILYVINYTGSRILERDNNSEYNGIFIRTNDDYFLLLTANHKCLQKTSLLKYSQLTTP